MEITVYQICFQTMAHSFFFYSEIGSTMIIYCLLIFNLVSVMSNHKNINETKIIYNKINQGGGMKRATKDNYFVSIRIQFCRLILLINSILGCKNNFDLNVSLFFFFIFFIIYFMDASKVVAFVLTENLLILCPTVHCCKL